MDLITAREIMLQASFLNLYHLFQTITVTKIIKPMLIMISPEHCLQLCLHLLEDSVQRNFQEETWATWKVLNNFCVAWFA